jgi:acetolactate synthase-1/2/3 large subunit
VSTTGQIIVKSLAANRIDRIFCVPGESTLGLLDALYDSDLDTVVCRHEAGAGFMALADARLTGRPGVACVSRGPGASNAAIAVHAADQEGIPFILLVGQVALRDLRRNVFQEIDYLQMFRSIAKWVAEVIDPDRVGEMLARGIRATTTGQRGPVVISIPEDVLTATSQAHVVKEPGLPRAAPDAHDLAKVRHWMSQAERPLVISGANLDSGRGRALLRDFLEEWNLPTVVSFRNHDLFPNLHRLYAGDMRFSNPTEQLELWNQSDFVLVLGARLNDITTQGYAFPRGHAPRAPVVQVHPDCTVLGNHSTPDLSIACDAGAFIEAMGESETIPSHGREGWIERLKAGQRVIRRPHMPDADDGVPFEAVAETLASVLPSDAIITIDAGAFAEPVYRLIPFAPPQRLLAPRSGAMGQAVPAAVASALREPERLVMCLVGDGGFLMTGNELAVAVERGLPIKVIVSENRMYGSVQVQQQRRYPGRGIGTNFVNPDLGLIGRAFGFNVTHVRTFDDLKSLAEVVKQPGPEFVVVETSMTAIMSACGGG